jgi:DNA-directed RNA polymerase subunit alpha
MSKNKHFSDIKIKVVDDSGNILQLEAEPFERGYGVTLGNSLRRILLTSIPGAAITSIKIDGVQHEFTAIDGVKEDLTEIVLNLKELRFLMKDEGPEAINFSVQGPCILKGKKLNEYLNDFEVLNGDHHIAEITTNRKLDIEMRVQRGRGYSLAKNNKRSNDTIGTIPIDALYNPILNVSWDVDPIATSSEGHERLSMLIESDGSTKPKDAINHAANIAREHYAFFLFDDSEAIRAVDNKELVEALETKNLLLKTIDEMELSVRSHNCLQAAGIKTIGELVSKDESQMLKFKNFGRKSLTELVAKLSELGIEFGMDISQYMNIE